MRSTAIFAGAIATTASAAVCLPKVDFPNCGTPDRPVRCCPETHHGHIDATTTTMVTHTSPFPPLFNRDEPHPHEANSTTTALAAVANPFATLHDRDEHRRALESIPFITRLTITVRKSYPPYYEEPRTQHIPDGSPPGRRDAPEFPLMLDSDDASIHSPSPATAAAASGSTTIGPTLLAKQPRHIVPLLPGLARMPGAAAPPATSAPSASLPVATTTSPIPAITQLLDILPVDPAIAMITDLPALESEDAALPPVESPKTAFIEKRGRAEGEEPDRRTSTFVDFDGPLPTRRRRLFQN